MILRQLQRQRPTTVLASAFSRAPTRAVAFEQAQATTWKPASITSQQPWRLFSTETEKKAEEAEPPKEEAAPEGEAEEAAAPEPTKEEQLEAQVKELKDQLMRSLAEQENTRKIASRDVASAKQFAIKSFAKSLLDVSDNLTRALEAVPEEARNKEENPVLTTLYEGIEMTDKGLLKAFEMNGLVKYGKVGEAFDPNHHDALYEYPDKEKTPGTIGQVMKPGFMLHKRVLRPAEVGVIKAE